VLVVVAATAACTTSQAPAPQAVDEILAAEGSVQPTDLVDLTVYYRAGRGRNANLQPVIREVPVNDDLPRTALTLLLEGPGADELRALQPPLPTSSRVRSFDVQSGTARVVLSRHAVTDLRSVGGKSPENEVMALAAVANTLTEFPDIVRVRLRIAGQRAGQFWGTWGLPQMLVRDETVISPQKRLWISDLEGFSRLPQRVGVAEPRRSAPAVGAVRVQSLSTYLRVTVEVTAANGEPLKGPVPPSVARRAGRSIVLRVRGTPRTKVAGTLDKQLRDPAFRSGRVDVVGRPADVVVRLRPRRDKPFWLHTLSEPARVVLDIQR
jgi:hypothetical protein